MNLDNIGPIVAIDYGTRRIGLAISDRNARLAFPVTTQSSTGSVARDAETVLAWATARAPVRLIVGLPLNMDGTDSAQTTLARRFAERLRTRTNLPVDLWDERLSSYQADLHLRSAGVRRQKRSALRDALAAQVILQSYLDAHSPGRPDDPPPTSAPPDGPADAT